MATTVRSTEEVFRDHLRLRAAHDLDADLQCNYAPDVVLLCRYGVFVGLDEVRESAARLHHQLPHARYEYLSCQTHGEYAFLEWRAESETCHVEDGADSYVIRGGRIVMQTIHYTLIPKNP
ncbi:MAG TPA: nuclear transport factor 2 family protein [Chloroflexota bacterium]|nr:nuclear transport factor 2 family protein [Chloroflexota bacterium]